MSEERIIERQAIVSAFKVLIPRLTWRGKGHVVIDDRGIRAL